MNNGIPIFLKWIGRWIESNLFVDIIYDVMPNWVGVRSNSDWLIKLGFNCNIPHILDYLKKRFKKTDNNNKNS